MACIILTAEAEVLARRLVRLTGETITEAVTVALRERLSREEAQPAAAKDMPARVAAVAAQIRPSYDTRPMSEAEWDAASGDEN